MNEAGLNIGACRCSDWLPEASSLDEVWAWRLLDGLARADALQMLTDNPLTLVEALQYAIFPQRQGFSICSSQENRTPASKWA